MILKIVRSQKESIETLIPTDFHFFSNIRDISASKSFSCPYPKENRLLEEEDGSSIKYEFFDFLNNEKICWLNLNVYYPNLIETYKVDIVFDTIAYICDDNGRTLEVIKVNEKK